MAAERHRVTYEDYRQLPDETRYEVLEGDLEMVPAPGYRHQRVLGRMFVVLAGQVEAKGFGEVNIAPFDVILSEDTVVQPDLLVVLPHNRGIIVPEGVRGAPDLVVEILSPGTAKRDKGIKRHVYGRHGVREYWIVDPDALTIEVIVNQDGHTETWGLFGAGARVESQVLRGLDLLVDQLLDKPAK